MKKTQWVCWFFTIPVGSDSYGSFLKHEYWISVCVPPYFQTIGDAREYERIVQDVYGWNYVTSYHITIALNVKKPKYI